MFVLLGASLSLVACASDYELDEGYMDEPCPYENRERVAKPAPVAQPAPVVQQAPVYQPAPVVQPMYTECAQPAPVTYAQPAAPCCQGEMRTVREPVEVVYKRTTYGTVYEPRHFQNVAYERQSVNGGYYQQPAYGSDYYVPAGNQAPAAQKPNAPLVIVPVQ